MIDAILNYAADHGAMLVRSVLWFGIAFMMLCRARHTGPDTRRMVRASIVATCGGAFGESLALFVPWTHGQAMAFDLLTAGGLFGLLLVFSGEWASGAPAVTRRR